MKPASILSADIASLTAGNEPIGVYVHLVNNEGAQQAWETLATRYSDIHRKHILTFIPECMLLAAANLESAALQKELLASNKAAIDALDLLMSRYAGLQFTSDDAKARYPGPICDMLMLLKDNINLTSKVRTTFRAETFPRSQKRGNVRLIFQLLLSDHLERTFGKPLIDFCARIGFAVYPGEYVDLKAVRRARTRDRKRVATSQVD